MIIEAGNDFDIEQTLECGQCFHFEKIGKKDYAIAAKGKLLRISQDEEHIIFHNITENEYADIWEEYFDLNRDYHKIKSKLIRKDPCLERAIREKYGIHILNQDFFETLISFIISQNKQITHIKKIVSEISCKYGKYLGIIEGKRYYAFPDAGCLSRVTEQEFRECRTGFRAPYLVDACKKVSQGIVTEERLQELSYEEAKKLLMKIKGVGEKVANCVLLFGLSRREAFPIDVWVKRIMEQLYFQKEMKIEQLQCFASEKYGSYGGYAQQYLFYYGKDHKIKK